MKAISDAAHMKKEQKSRNNAAAKAVLISVNAITCCIACNYHGVILHLKFSFTLHRAFQLNGSCLEF